jgi:beta-mannosidase
MLRKSVAIVLTSQVAMSIASQQVINLSTLEWTLKNDTMHKSLRATVPSHVHLDLYREGVIEDPYFGLNDFDLRWVALTNWTYTTSVTGL